MTEITHAKALLAIAAKPTLALARKMAEAKGYDPICILVYGDKLHDGKIWRVYLGARIVIYAPTRTAALAGLIAVIDALPKRKGKR